METFFEYQSSSKSKQFNVLKMHWIQYARRHPKEVAKEEVVLLDTKRHQAFWKMITTSSIFEDACDRIREGSGTPAQSDEDGRIVLAVTVLLRAFMIDERTEKRTPKGMIDAIKKLHGMIFPLGRGGDDARNVVKDVAETCRTWWCQNRPAREEVVSQLLPYLLIMTMTMDGGKGDVRALYSLREAFKVLDIEHESSESVRQLCLKCFFNPIFLQSKTNDGHKFLSFIMCSLGVPFLRDAHETMKQQMQGARTAVLGEYGKLYFRAWCFARDAETTAVTQTDFENICVQNLVFHGIHAGDAKVLRAVRVILSAFFSNKEKKDVDPMIYRVFKPLIWRALNAANPIVRSNATALLSEAFPLHDPNMAHADSEDLLQRQCEVFRTLLRDTNPKVRSIATKGVCRVLGLYWQLVPFTSVQPILTVLVADLAHDRSSSMVRAAVFEGLAFLLSNRLCHGVLKKLLPSLAPCIHDSSERVRVAFVKMLLCVRSLRTIRFYDVVNLNALLDRLAEDRDRKKVASSLTRLLLNSFFPRQGGRERQLGRAIVLIRRNPEAAYAFFEHLHVHVPLGDVCKLFAMMTKVVLNATSSNAQNDDGGVEVMAPTPAVSGRSKRKSVKRKKEADVDEEEDEEEEDDALRDEEIVDADKTTMDRNMLISFLLCMEALHIGARAKLARRDARAAKKYLSDAVCKDGRLMDLLNHFESDATARAAVWRIIGAVVESESRVKSKPRKGRKGKKATPVSSADDFVTRAESEVVNLTSDAEELGCIDALQLLCRWKREDGVLSRVVESLQQWLLVDDETTAIKSATRKKKRGRRGRSKTTLPPFQALRVLEFILSSGDASYGARDRFLNSELGGQIQRMLGANAMNVIAQKLAILRRGDDATSASSTSTTAEDCALLLRAVLLHCRLALHDRAQSIVKDHADGAKPKPVENDDVDIDFGSTPQQLVAFYRWVSEDVADVLAKASSSRDGETSTSALDDVDVASPPRSRRRGKKQSSAAVKKVTLRRRHEISTARSLAWNILCAAINVATECVSLGFGTGPNVSDVTSWIGAMKSHMSVSAGNQALFTPVVINKFASLANELYRRGRFDAKYSSSANVVLREILSTTATETKLSPSVSKEIRRCVQAILRAQSRRQKGLDIVVPVLLQSMIRSRFDGADIDVHNEDNDATCGDDTNTIVCKLLSGSDQMIRSTLKILVRVIKETFESASYETSTNEEDATSAALLRLLSFFVESSSGVSTEMVPELSRCVSTCQKYLSGSAEDSRDTKTSTPQKKVSNVPLSPFASMPLPKVMVDGDSKTVDDEFDGPLGDAFGDLRAQVAHLTIAPPPIGK